MPFAISVVALAGCATKLDFDRVAEGRRFHDSGALPPDASVDASLDATFRQSASEAGADVAQAPATFSCDRERPTPVLCDDFEDEALLKRWGDVTVYPQTPLLAGTIERDETARRSGESSLLAAIHPELEPCHEDNCYIVGIGKHLPDYWGSERITIEFDLRVDEVDVRPARRVMLFRFFTGRDDIGYTWHSLMLESGGDRAVGDRHVSVSFTEWEADGVRADATELPPLVPWEHTLQPALRLYEWSHFKYVLDVSGTGSEDAVATVTLGGAVLFQGPPSYSVRMGRSRLEMGLPSPDFSKFTAGEKTAAWRVHYDNVLVRFEPVAEHQ